MRQIEYEKFLDKVHGCWYGKCLGGAAGAPIEGIKKLNDIKDFTEIFNPDLPNDDLDLQLLWLDVLEKKGTIITSCDLADAWMEKCWYPFSEYGYFLKNYMRGVLPPYSGILNNSFFKEGMGCPIRSEIWGIISAGNPALATEYAYLDATLDHADNSVYAEQFLAAVEAEAFFEENLQILIEKGRSYIPKDCKLNQAFETVIRGHDQGMSWEKARKMILEHFSHPDFTNVVQNLAFVLIALLYGEGDMRKTVNIALRCGYDTDCTCASAASIIGIIRGYEALGDTKDLINDYFVCGIDVVRPSDSIKRLAGDSAKIALKTPNFETLFLHAPEEVKRPKERLHLEYAAEEGLSAAKRILDPIKWSIFGPYFDQLDQPDNPEFPRPGSENSVLPDCVCMVNNEVFLDKKYVVDLNLEEPSFVLDAYEDFIDVESQMTMEGQMCCYAKANIISPKKQTVWLIIGNTDGFRIYANGKNVLEKDEIRMWTPYNNFTRIELLEGKNEFVIKLLRRTDHLRFSIGFRIYDGNYWHMSKWCTDLKSE